MGGGFPGDASEANSLGRPPQPAGADRTCDLSDKGSFRIYNQGQRDAGHSGALLKIGFEFTDDHGPKILNPIRTAAQVDGTVVCRQFGHGL